jgi:hypothetical protein
MKKSKINAKKAELLPEEVAKIILGVIGIALLLMLGVSLYSIFISKTQIEQARSTLDMLIGKAQALEIGSKTTMIITSPKDWTIYFFNKNDNSPKDCAGSYCSCICKQSPTTITGALASLSDIVSSCESKGLCKKSNRFIWPQLSLGKSYFELKNLPQEYTLENKAGAIYIS